MRAGRATRGIFLRYIVNNILILLLPILLSLVFYTISIRELQDAVDSATANQLHQSMVEIDRLLTDTFQMATTLATDYEVNYYLTRTGELTGVEQFNLKRISQKLAPYVLGNSVVDHALIYIDGSGFLVFENGFGRYEELYGSLLSVEGFTNERWLREVLRLRDPEGLILDQHVDLAGNSTQAHIYLRPIGFGDYYRGSLVAIIDVHALRGLLADLPEQYGGVVFLEDRRGRLLTSTARDDFERGLYARVEAGSNRLRADGQDFRVYRASSLLHGWRFTALVSRTRLFSGVGLVRTIALVLIGLAFVAGTGLSYAFANRNAQPIGRVIDLVLGGRDEPARARTTSMYEHVEQAILVLSNTNRRLEDEMKAARRIAHVHFFQNLLRGYYRTRDGFHEDRRLFEIEFAPASYSVIVCRIASLNAARDGSSIERVRQTLLSAIDRAITRDDFVAPVSLDDIAVIRAVREPESTRSDATTLIARIRSGSDAVTAGDYSFGVGLPTEDPYLLVVSNNQAVAAVSSIMSSGQNMVQFYADLPNGGYSYYYPLDLEENIMRAVRSSSQELLEPLCESVERENFEQRQLSVEQMGNLFVELQGTALRMLNDLPEGTSEISTELSVWSATPPSREKLNAFKPILGGLSELYDMRKNSHNSVLLAAVRDYVESNFSDPDLSLTRIADTFGKSENYLSNFYKEQTGENLSVAIQKLRFAEASKLLIGTDTPIDIVAEQCGYTSAGSFRRAFKRFNGVSPSEYRDQREDRLQPSSSTLR